MYVRVCSCGFALGVCRQTGRETADPTCVKECPHSSYPLSNGTPFDVEDFGVVLSAGITCPKHAWSFDLHTGQADRGRYKLHIWDVQQRPSTTTDGAMEIWIRRKQKMG